MSSSKTNAMRVIWYGHCHETINEPRMSSYTLSKKNSKVKTSRRLCSRVDLQLPPDTSNMIPSDNNYHHGASSRNTMSCIRRSVSSSNCFANSVATTTSFSNEAAISISQPTTPVLATPIGNSNHSSITPPPRIIKNIHSLDRELRSRKRRRTEQVCCMEEDGEPLTNHLPVAPRLKSPGQHSSQAINLERIRLPPLAPLEDCVNSHHTCLPDTSYLVRKTTLRRRRKGTFRLVA
mmetsp:Transcript_9469/g.28243  ORF Transcript_9469/g.28243 Transcript_9469/m.28243 type:complete len:235 (-) Transcript_9469:2561-3265(-)